MISLPPTFFAHTRVAWEGAAGRAWAESLPSLVADLCGRWRLSVDGDVRHGAQGIAVPVCRGGEPYVLKVGWLDQDLRDQIVGLTLWDGRGTVRLEEVSADDGALLLERLDASRSLRTLDVHASLTVAAGLLRRLAVPVPAGDTRVRSLPTTAEAARGFADSAAVRSAALGGAVPARVLDPARRLAASLADVGGDRLVDHDLHDDNVLAAEREPWLAIDPKVAVGAPEYAVAPLLWWRLDELADDADIRRCLDLVVGVAGLDPALARAWTVVRSVGYWLWGLENGLTIDPVRCARLVDALVAGA